MQGPPPLLEVSRPEGGRGRDTATEGAALMEGFKTERARQGASDGARGIQDGPAYVRTHRA